MEKLQLEIYEVKEMNSLEVINNNGGLALPWAVGFLAGYIGGKILDSWAQSVSDRQVRMSKTDWNAMKPLIDHQ